jgi:hypothetical protein
MLQRIIFSLLLVLIGAGSATAQKRTAWEDLAKVKFALQYDEETETYLKRPIFGKTVKGLEGDLIEIEGYIIPLEMTDNYYVLSANPYSQCFFCGNAGLETVIKLNLVGEYENLRMDQLITVEGRLQLNRGDIYELIYIIEDAEITAIN